VSAQVKLWMPEEDYDKLLDLVDAFVLEDSDDEVSLERTERIRKIEHELAVIMVGVLG